MTTQTLLSDGVWTYLAKLAANHHRLIAAISYVTARHLEFRKGDLLVCDASDDAIRGGLTSAAVLRAFHTSKAQLYSYPGLHSKVAVINESALVGSANQSQNAGIGTCEASLLSDDPQTVGLVLAFIESVKNEATPIDQDFLTKIEAIPVSRTDPIARTGKRKITIGQSRLWFVATEVLSEKIAEAEKDQERRGLAAAKKFLKKGYEMHSIRFTGQSKFRLEAKAGDSVIECCTERHGKKKIIEVYRASPIIHRFDENNWTRFYLARPKIISYYSWKDTKADFRNLGVTNITPATVRELTGKSSNIVHLML